MSIARQLNQSDQNSREACDTFAKGEGKWGTENRGIEELGNEKVYQ